MPTVLRRGPYRFFFYPSDGEEPQHVHVERDRNVAKFWVSPVRLQSSGWFNRSEIAVIYKIIVSNRQRLAEAWNEYFHG